MKQYRLTKYDPRYRDASGAYTRDEWTFFAQVGREVGGRTVTLDEYEAVEAAYIRVVCALVDLAAIGPYHVADPENAPYAAGSNITLEQLSAVLRSLLREEYWCRLSDSEGYFIHSGWDFYLYLGLPNTIVAPETIAAEQGLFLEPFVSPYHSEAP
ncbi:MAG: hypothetical protein ACPGYV_03470 [Phycisphaeraceae bacterium]